MSRRLERLDEPGNAQVEPTKALTSLKRLNWANRNTTKAQTPRWTQKCPSRTNEGPNVSMIPETPKLSQPQHHEGPNASMNPETPKLS